MAHLSQIVDALDELLQPGAFADHGPNGLQVPGREEVRKVVTGVSAHRELIERAIAADADLLLVHHGLFWSFHPVGLTPVLAERLRLLFNNDLSLAAYHLPLDGHAEFGNNALLARELGCERQEPFAVVGGAPIGRIGHFPGEGIGAAELLDRVQTATGRRPLAFESGPETVRTIGVVTGAAAKTLPEAVALGLDAFLTGEPAEHVMADAREAGIHFIAAGHYATETFGVRRLGEWLAERFGVAHEFVHVPNPV
jgi:dinuclear metal center YbgI/SA1388 family protein